MSEDNVVSFGETKLDIAADRVLRGALEHGLTHAIVIGYTADGNEYFAFSSGDAAVTVWLLERAKKFLLEAPELNGV